MHDSTIRAWQLIRAMYLGEYRKILDEAGLGLVELVPIKSSELERAARRPAYSVLGMQKFMDTTGKTMQPWQLAFSDYYKYITTRTCLAQAAGPPGR